MRREGPEHLDIVDVSASVLAMANRFPQNEGVLARYPTPSALAGD